MATVNLNGRTYNSADLAGYGHLDPTVGFFAILNAMVAELAAADTVQGVAPGASGNVLTSNGTAWTSVAPVVNPANSVDNVLTSQVFS